MRWSEDETLECSDSEEADAAQVEKYLHCGYFIFVAHGKQHAGSINSQDETAWERGILGSTPQST